MSDNIKRLGNIYGRTGGSFSGNVYGINGIAPTLNCMGGAYGASGVIEIETMQELINADSNGNARAIRACYGQCGFDSVFRGGGKE